MTRPPPCPTREPLPYRRLSAEARREPYRDRSKSNLLRRVRQVYCYRRVALDILPHIWYLAPQFDRKEAHAMILDRLYGTSPEACVRLDSV